MEGLYSFLFTSSVFIIAVVLLRALLQNKISMRVQYALWAFVAVKLLIVPVPQIESVLSIQRLSEPWIYKLNNQNNNRSNVPQQGLAGVSGQGQQDVSGNAGWKNTSGYPADGTSQTGSSRADSRQQYGGSQLEQKDTAKITKVKSVFSWDLEKIIQFLTDVSKMDQAAVMQLLVFTAGAGSIVLFLYFLIENIRFMAYLKRRRVRYLGNSGPLPVYLAEGLPSPCLYGRAVYITPNLSVDEQQLAHVLTHEYCHFRQKDYIWSVLRCICLIIYWWNPLVWLAASMSKQDCELACDEAAVALLGEDERIGYGKTLIRLVSVKTEPKDYFCIATTMTGGGRSMRKRIKRIAKNQKGILPAGILAVLLSVICLVSVSTVKPAESKQAAGQNHNAEKRSGDHLWKEADLQETQQDNPAQSEGMQKAAPQPAGGNDTGQNVPAQAAGGNDTGQNVPAQAAGGNGTGQNAPAQAAGGNGTGQNAPAQAAGGNDTGQNAPAQAAGDEPASANQGRGAEADADHASGAGENGTNDTAVFDLDEAISQAVLTYNKERYGQGECVAQGHEILEQKQEADGSVTVYAITMFGWYGFEDDCLVKVSGSGMICNVLTFSLDKQRGYLLEDYKEPLDGGYYVSSVRDMFPEHLWDTCLIYDEKRYNKLQKQEYAYARQYLKKIGRQADVTEHIDREGRLMTDAGVSVKVSNKMSDMEKLNKYPYWIGSREEIIDGVRYVYKMDVDQEAGEIIYTKSVYDTGETVEQHRFDLDTGKKL